MIVPDGIDEHYLLDIWTALGGDYPTWVKWRQSRSFADGWAQLLRAVAGDWASLMADTNPPAGDVADLVAPRGEADPNRRWGIAKWLAGLIGELTGAELDASDCYADADELIAYLKSGAST